MLLIALESLVKGSSGMWLDLTLKYMVLIQEDRFFSDYLVRFPHALAECSLDNEWVVRQPKEIKQQLS